MQRKTLTVLQVVASCALWLCAFPMLHTVVPAQTTKETTADKTLKTKKPKKSTVVEEATPSKATTPAETGPKTMKSKKAKKAVSDATSSQATTPAEAGGKAVRSKRGSAARAASDEGKATVPAPVRNASRTEIQAAKAGGKVWVNTDSGIYHKGGQWFGATKQGKFMTEQEAVKAGYKPAKNEK